MSLRRWLVLSLVVFGMLGTEARAHFLFIKISPMAESGRSAEVFFSEQAEAGDPRFVAKIAGTRLWAQSTPGKFEPLQVRQGTDRLRALVPASGSVSVIGACEYGVLARPNETPFLLRHYPKAIAGRPEDLNRFVPRPEIPLEIMAKVEQGHIQFLVLQEGKPLPKAVLHAVDSDLAETKLTTGDDGTTTWTPPSPSRYSVYTDRTVKQAGELGGKSYEVIREFATIAFAWPLERPKVDPEAVSLFEDALSARAQWKDFPGFTSQVAGEVDGRPFEGKATVRADGSVDIQVDDPIARPWLEDQLRSIAMHRLPEPVDPSRPKPVLRFADDEDAHPLGRLLAFDGGRFASSYRIKDQQIMVVNRQVGDQNVTITVIDNERNRDGQYLPRSYSVQYWDTKTGKLDHVETIQERWQRVGAWDLPTSHTTTTTSDAGLSVRTVTLSESSPLGPK